MLHYCQKGIPGKDKPRLFRKDFVRGMLNQVFYAGKVPYFGKNNGRRVLENVFEGKHPAIVSEDEFQHVQELRKSIGGAAPPRHKKYRVYPLTGILFCGTCGWPLRGTSTHTAAERFYVDAWYVERRDVCDDQFRYRAFSLEKEVANLLREAIRAWEQAVNPELVSSNLADIEAQLQRAQELYIRGEISKDVMDREKARLDGLVKPLQEQEFAASLAAVRKLQPALANWSKVNTIEQKRLLRIAAETVFVRENALVALQPTFEFNPVLQLLLQGSNNCGPDGIRNSDA